MINTHSSELPDICKTLVIEAPIRKVWETVATSEGIAAWFMPNDFQPVQDREFYLDAGPMGRTPCKVTLIEAPERLTYDWCKDWTLAFELNDLDGRTEFRVVHSGWDAGKTTEFGQTHTEIYDHMVQGWTLVTNRLTRALKKMHGM